MNKEICNCCNEEIESGIFIEGTGEHYCDDNCLKNCISKEEIKELEKDNLITGFRI